MSNENATRGEAYLDWKLANRRSVRVWRIRDTKCSAQPGILHDSIYDELEWMPDRFYRSPLVRLCLCVGAAEALGCDALTVRCCQKCYRVLGGRDGAIAFSRVSETGTRRRLQVTIQPSTEQDCEHAVTHSGVTGAGNLVLFSGGLDCTVATDLITSTHDRTGLVFFTYGQLNDEAESALALRTGSRLSIPLFAVSIREFFSRITWSSGLLDPESTMSYENAGSEYVPFRNSILLAFALEIAASEGYQRLVTGSHQDDQLSPDNSQQFYDLWNLALTLMPRYSSITVEPILMRFGGKREIIALGVLLGTPLSDTYSCHNRPIRGLTPCGHCRECLTRATAFAEIGVVDGPGSNNLTIDSQLLNKISKTLEALRDNNHLES